MADARLVVHLLTDRRRLDTGLKGALGGMKAFVGRALAIAAPLAAAFSLRAATQAAQTQIRADRKLEAVLRSTGNAAGLTADQIKRYASELQTATDFGDELTVNAAAQLATFTNIQGRVFKDALAVAQDLSVVMDQDLRSSIVQIGKALNDPIKGVTALTRVGVSFTQQQKDQIRTLQQSGDLLGAQTIIMRELKREFGGAAAATADPLKQLENTVGDLAENLGFTLLPTIRKLSNDLRAQIDVSTASQDQFSAFGENLANDVVPKIEAAASMFGTLGKAIAWPLKQIHDLTDAAFEATAALHGLPTSQARPNIVGQINARDAAKAQSQLTPEQIAAFMPGMSNRALRPDEAFAARQAGGAGNQALRGTVMRGANRAVEFFKDVEVGWEQFTQNAEIAFERAVAEQEAWIDSQKEIQNLIERTRTDEERFAAERERLTNLFGAGRIDADLFQRGLKLAQEDFGVRERAPVGGVAAVEARSTEAFSIIQAAIRGGMGGDSQKKIEKYAQQSAVSLARIDVNTRNLPNLEDVELA